MTRIANLFRFSIPPPNWRLQLIVLLAVFSGIVYAIVLKNITQKYNVISIIIYQNVIGIFAFLPLFLILPLIKSYI